MATLLVAVASRGVMTTSFFIAGNQCAEGMRFQSLHALDSDDVVVLHKNRRVVMAGHRRSGWGGNLTSALA